MLKSIQESINKYIKTQQTAEIITKDVVLKTIPKTIKKVKKNQIINISLKEKIIFIKTTNSEAKQEILLNKNKIIQKLREKKIQIIDIK